MFEQLAKFKRQVEILGLALDRSSGHSVPDLADRYGCEDLTIKRDLGELRSSGIDIHSRRQDGVRVESPIPRPRLRELLAQYLSLAASASGAEKAVALLMKSQRERALPLVILLQQSVERRTAAVIDYEKEDGIIERERSIHPLLLFESDGYWRVLARNDGRIKQYHLNKIRAARETRERFAAVPQAEIEAMFRHSFRSWIGTKEFTVRIRLSPEWARRIKPRQVMESQVIDEHPDGSVDFVTTVNSLEEIAAWIVSRGEGVTVLEPPELREMVLGLATGALRNYTH